MTIVNRRTFLLAGAASAVPTSATITAGQARAAGRPANVLWIITDDQTRLSLPYMRGTWNWLVDSGQRFPNGYTAVPWCGPARASMLTGLYSGNHGCSVNKAFSPFVAQGLDEDTVATRLAGAGYVNGYFGKYLNGHYERPEYVAPGWQRWVANINASHRTTLFNIDGQLVDTVRAADHFAALNCESFIRDHSADPWFAVFAPTAPHSPYEPSRRHEEDFDDVTWQTPSLNERRMGDKPRWMRDRKPRPRGHMREAWEGALEELQDLDDHVLRLRAVLAETGQLESTWVFFVSDNGYLLGEHRLEGKEMPYEENTGIPFVVAGPGVRPGTPRALASQVDLMPTTLDIAGLDPYGGRIVDGRSLVTGLLTGSWQGWRRRLFCENEARGWAMLREGSWTYINHHGRGGVEEAYDLARDPYQLRSRHASIDTGPWLDRVRAFRGATGASLRDLETAR